MRTHRGLSAVVGTVFLVAVVIGALSYVTYSMNILGNFSESLITEEKRQKDKQGEAFEITSVEITPASKLDGIITNTGQIPLEIKSLWIEEVGAANSVKKFDIGTTIAPGNQLDLIDSVDFDMDAAKGYAMKVVSGRGEVQTFYVNSVGSNSLYLTSRTIPEVVSTEFDTTVLFTVTNNSTNNAPILNLTPDTLGVDVSTCTPSCTATYVSGPTPSFYPSLKQGETATFAWVYTVAGADANKITFTASLLNGVPTNTATSTVEVRDIVSALESGTAIESQGLGSLSRGSHVLLFHQETDRTPSTSYQMFSATADGGNNGLKIELDSTTPNFFTNNGTNIINIPAGDWITSLRLQSEALPTSLKGEGEDMIFHFNVNEANPDNSESTATADLEGCGPVTWTQKILSDNDDAEQQGSSVDFGGSDLELSLDGNTANLVGMRFTAVPIPQGSTIQSAYIQFTTDESQTGTTVNVRIRGEAADDAAAITESSNNISARTDTTASVTWSAIPSWSTVSEAGINQKTPDIKTIIQEIVNRGGWSSGNDLLIQIENNGSTASTRRTAESHDGSTSGAPELQISYTPSGGSGVPPSYESQGGPHSSGTYVFDGTNDCLRSKNNVSSSDGNHINTAPDTTALWFKTATTVGATEQHLVSWEGDGTCPSCDYYKIALEANTGKIVFEFNTDQNTGDTSTCKSNGRYDDTLWYHVVAVRESTNDNCSLYITKLDGTDAETPISISYNYPGSSQVNADGRWYIGSNGVENGNFFNGKIDDVIHWDNKALSGTEADDLSHANYGTVAHKLNLYIDKSDQDGVNLSNIVSTLVDVPFYDPKGTNNENADSTYGVFNKTNTLGAVTMSANQRLNFTISYVPSTSTWKALEIDMKIDDQDMTPMTSLLQIPPPDVPFSSYWMYDKSNRLEVSIYNVGPYGSWFVYQGTRAVFDNPTAGTSYAAVICSVNSTQSDPCDTSGANSSWRVMEDRDSIFIPVGSIGVIYFWDVQDRPDRDLSGGTEIPAGDYDMYVFIDGYDEKGDKFLRNLEMGRVKVQD